VLAAVTAQSAAKAVQEEGTVAAERCAARAAALAASTTAVTEQQGDVRADTERLHGEAASAAEARAARAAAAATARFDEAVRARAAALQAAAEVELKAETAAVAASMEQMNTDIALKAQQQATTAKAAEAAFEQVLADKAEEVRRVTVELVELKRGRSSTERGGSQETAAAATGRGGRAVQTKPKPKRATAGGSRQRRR
jgi:colicin import membrane protein